MVKRLQGINIPRLVRTLINEQTNQNLHKMSFLTYGITLIQDNFANCLLRDATNVMVAIRRMMSNTKNDYNYAVNKPYAMTESHITLLETPFFLDYDGSGAFEPFDIMDNMPVTPGMVDDSTLMMTDPDYLHPEYEQRIQIVPTTTEGLPTTYEIPTTYEFLNTHEIPSHVSNVDNGINEDMSISSNHSFNLEELLLLDPEESPNRGDLTETWLDHVLGITTSHFEPMDTTLEPLPLRTEFEIPAADLLTPDVPMQPQEYDWAVFDSTSVYVSREPDPVREVPVWVSFPARQVPPESMLGQRRRSNTLFSEENASTSGRIVPHRQRRRLEMPSHMATSMRRSQSTSDMSHLVIIGSQDPAAVTNQQVLRRQHYTALFDRVNTIANYDRLDPSSIVNNPNDGLFTRQPTTLTPAQQAGAILRRIMASPNLVQVPGFWTRVRRNQQGELIDRSLPTEMEMGRGEFQADREAFAEETMEERFVDEVARHAIPLPYVGSSSSPVHGSGGSPSEIARSLLHQGLADGENPRPSRSRNGRTDSVDFGTLDLNDDFNRATSIGDSSFPLLNFTSGDDAPETDQEPDYADLIEQEMEQMEPIVENPEHLDMFYWHLVQSQSIEEPGTMTFQTVFSPNNPTATRSTVSLAFFNILVLTSQGNHRVAVHQDIAYGPIILKLTDPVTHRHWPRSTAVHHQI
ncbi:hypothetical protein DM01DRAFT_1405521 [Hesseltinella vesiculosa]|uniref:Uncharacterized protein n=1 Tax=Hesseltinella vesiculosa TaxID=101127 RepID=A0A1X2GQ74_9FUNG|nr:hypothetical protein DM01DRAFT_1405521 [Hesseltinella vesiculosa]